MIARPRSEFDGKASESLDNLGGRIHVLPY